MIYIAAAAFVVAVIALRVAYRADQKVSLCQQQLVKQLVAKPEAIAEPETEPEAPATEENPPPSGPDVPGDVLWDVCGPWVDQARKEAGWR